MKGSTVVVLAACAVVAWPAVASGDSATHTYLLEMEAPNVAQAPNGDQVAITGEGEFQVHPKSVQGEGRFTHTNAAGTVLATGTWSATKLVAYQSYGCGVVEGDPLPPDVCGGKVKMAVVLTPEGTSLEIPAILTVFCIIGPNPPNSHDDLSGEGITLVVPGIINFNTVVSGENVYIQTS
jgi:hypothetical protein